MTADRLPSRKMPTVAEDYGNFLERVEFLEEALLPQTECPSGHALVLTHANLEWPAEEDTYLLGPTPVYKDEQCQTTFIPSIILPIAEKSLKASVKSPQSYEFTLPAGTSPIA